MIEKPGIYRGQCAELCGMHHGFMPIVVRAVTDQEYQQWVAKHRKGQVEAAKIAAEPAKDMTKDALMALGKKVYTTHCAVCHRPSGEGMPPAFPALKGGKITTGPVKGHIHIVLHGVTGTAMQAWGSQLNDEDLAAVVTYERNNWGNSDKAKYGNAAGGIVQPAEIAKNR